MPFMGFATSKELELMQELLEIKYRKRIDLLEKELEKERMEKGTLMDLVLERNKNRNN